MPVFEIVPLVLKVAHPAEPPAEETVRLVVDAMVAENVVLVALVEVELVDERFTAVDEPER